MNKEELIGKLQMVYARDINALNELIGYYDGLKQGIEELQQEYKELKEDINKYKRLGYKHLQEQNNKLEERIDKAIEKLYCWGEALNPEFQKIMLDILKEVK